MRNRRLPEPDPNDSDECLRPRSHREIVQQGPTVFKIESDKWNNVPKVVFEAVVALVTQVDQMKVLNNQVQQEIKLVIKQN